jgi:hypothetical protein
MKFSILPGKSFTDTKVIEFNTLDELAEHILKSNYSSSIFRDNYTKNDNFLSSEMIILDYDNVPGEPNLSLADAVKTFADYKCIIAPTRNHRKEKKVGDKKLPAVDRFRVILFLSEPVTTQEDYYASWHAVAANFPGVDNATKDPARRFYPSSGICFKNEDGKLITPARAVAKVPSSNGRQLSPGERGILSAKTRDFMEHGAKPGEWNARLYKAARDYLQQGYSEEEFIIEANQIEEELDYKDLRTVESAFSKPAKHPPRTEVENDTQGAAERWVREWLEDNHVTLSYQTGRVTFKGVSQPSDFIFARMVLDAKHWAETHPMIDDKGKEKARMPYTPETLGYCYSVWEKEQRDEVIDYYRDLISYVPGAGIDAMEKFVAALTGVQDALTFNLDVAVMKHFIWQVKRKLNDLPVEWHMMPILSGKTGGGKTRAMLELLKVIDELHLYAPDLTILNDSREAHLFGKYYVIFFDEMSKAEKLDVSAMKNKITSPTVSYRKLGTNINCNDDNRATFLGATNHHVQDIIYDPTSARRYWQIGCAERVNHSVVNELDYLSLWRSIDEQGVSPIIPFLDEITVIQENKLRAKTLVETWLDETMITTTEHNNWWPAGFAHKVFLEWCQMNGFRNVTITRNKFGRMMSATKVEKRVSKQATEYRLTEKEPASTHLKKIN